MRLLFLAVIASALAGCTEDYDDQSARLEQHLKGRRIGFSTDVWLVKHNAFGDLEKVGLIFGFVDDREFCEEIAGMYMRKYPRDKYLCTPAN